MSYLGRPPAAEAYATYNETFSGNSVLTVFTLARPVGRASDLDVYVAGVPMMPIVDYNASGTTLTFVSPPGTATDNITVVYRAIGIITVNPLDGSFAQG